MTRKRTESPPSPREPGWYYGADIPMRVIRRYARQIAEVFHPEKVILFGSRAYGSPHADSDVDLLVVMLARNELDQAFRISDRMPAPFPLDLIVRTPHNMAWRLREGDWFLREVTTLGKTLYDATDERVGQKSGTRPSRRATRRSPS